MTGTPDCSTPHQLLICSLLLGTMERIRNGQKKILKPSKQLGNGSEVGPRSNPPFLPHTTIQHNRQNTCLEKSIFYAIFLHSGLLKRISADLTFSEAKKTRPAT